MAIIDLNSSGCPADLPRLARPSPWSCNCNFNSAVFFNRELPNYYVFTPARTLQVRQRGGLTLLANCTALALLILTVLLSAIAASQSLCVSGCTHCSLFIYKKGTNTLQQPRTFGRRWTLDSFSTGSNVFEMLKQLRFMFAIIFAYYMNQSLNRSCISFFKDILCEWSGTDVEEHTKIIKQYFYNRKCRKCTDFNLLSPSDVIDAISDDVTYDITAEVY